MRHLATLTKDDARSLEIALNKLTCAQQAIHPKAVPPDAPLSARDRFFREAIFAYADAQYLRNHFWQSLAKEHGIAEKDMDRMYVDFSTSKLLMRD
jgi:hypothetical protein